MSERKRQRAKRGHTPEHRKRLAADIWGETKRRHHELSEEEDEARTALERWAAECRSLLRSLEQRDVPEQPEEKRRLLKTWADEQLEHIPQIVLAAETGANPWIAVYHALWVGLMQGQMQGYPYQYHANRNLRIQAPDTERGRALVNSAKKGGREKGRSIATEELVELLEAKRKKSPDLSYTRLTDLLSADLKKRNITLGGAAIRTRLRSMRRNR